MAAPTAWPTVAVVCAAALNSIKGEANAINRRRHWDSPLDASLYGNNPQLKWWNDLVTNSGGVTFLSNSASVILAAVQEGFGIAMLPTFYNHLFPDLVMLSIDTSCQVDLWMVTHESTNRSAKVRAVTNFLKARFARDRARWFS